MSRTVFLALGSNLGDRQANLKIALATLPPVVQPIACSPIYETMPWGFLDQPTFLNQVIQAETNLGPQELLEYLKSTEGKLGRKPGFQNGPRLIDMDILFMEDLVYQSAELVIPHPRIAERAFVLVPLVDLAPDLPHPLLGQTTKELLARVDAAGIEWFSAGDCNQPVPSTRSNGDIKEVRS